MTNTDQPTESTLHPSGNPQGKGLALVLERLAGLAPTGVRAKPIEAILSDYWQSTLVLSADFSFRVVPDKQYFLYHGERWLLSLIAPDEWGSRCPGVFVAQCQLQRDATWSVVFADALAEQPEVLEALQRFLEGFEHKVSSADSLVEALPEYEASLPYQQRMMATALTTSLRHSARLSGCSTLPPRLVMNDWKALSKPLD